WRAQPSVPGIVTTTSRRKDQCMSRTSRLSLLIFLVMAVGAVAWSTAVTEAPAAFDNQSNGFTSAVQFNKDKDIFAEVEDNDEGVGLTYNARSCAECHENPVVGAISQITE